MITYDHNIKGNHSCCLQAASICGMPCFSAAGRAYRASDLLLCRRFQIGPRSPEVPQSFPPVVGTRRLGYSCRGPWCRGRHFFDAQLGSAPLCVVLPSISVPKRPQIRKDLSRPEQSLGYPFRSGFISRIVKVPGWLLEGIH